MYIRNRHWEHLVTATPQGGGMDQIELGWVQASLVARYLRTVLEHVHGQVLLPHEKGHLVVDERIIIFLLHLHLGVVDW